MFDKTGVIAECRSTSYITGIGIFDLIGSCDLDLDQMTFEYELDQYSLEMYRVCEMNFLLPLFRKLLSDSQTTRHTADRTEIIYHTTSRLVVNNNNHICMYSAICESLRAADVDETKFYSSVANQEFYKKARKRQVHAANVASKLMLVSSHRHTMLPYIFVSPLDACRDGAIHRTRPVDGKHSLVTFSAFTWLKSSTTTTAV